MLDLKKFVKTVATNHSTQNIERLRKILEEFGQPGIDRLRELVLDESAPELARFNALNVLGVDRVLNQIAGDSALIDMIETVAHSKTAPLLANAAFYVVYRLALEGRKSSFDLVEQFRNGTQTQQNMFKSADRMYSVATRLFAMSEEIVKRNKAKWN